MNMAEMFCTFLLKTYNSTMVIIKLIDMDW